MILNLYKPQKLLSFNFIHKVQKKLDIQKIGHCGTLDPLASGVMIIVTDKDTKKQKELTLNEKTYIAEILFGACSKSLDFETEVVFNEIPPKIEFLKVFEACLSLKGNLSLPAPIFSAKWVSGTRLYDLAKRGENLENIPNVTSKIYDINVLEFRYFWNLGKTYPLLKIEVRCSSGTYIRSIAKYIGEMLKVDSLLFSLVRTKVGDFSISDSQRLILE
jgi:tRNA pseudouridine55 synthase